MHQNPVKFAVPDTFLEPGPIKRFAQMRKFRTRRLHVLRSASVVKKLEAIFE